MRAFRRLFIRLFVSAVALFSLETLALEVDGVDATLNGETGRWHWYPVAGHSSIPSFNYLRKVSFSDAGNNYPSFGATFHFCSVSGAVSFFVPTDGFTNSFQVTDSSVCLTWNNSFNIPTQMIGVTGMQFTAIFPGNDQITARNYGLPAEYQYFVPNATQPPDTPDTPDNPAITVSNSGVGGLITIGISSLPAASDFGSDGAYLNSFFSPVDFLQTNFDINFSEAYAPLTAQLSLLAGVLPNNNCPLVDLATFPEFDLSAVVIPPITVTSEPVCALIDGEALNTETIRNFSITLLTILILFNTFLPMRGRAMV